MYCGEDRMHLKYANLTQVNIFVPVVDMSGLIGLGASCLFHAIGHKISRDRDDPHQTTLYLFQRLSLAIVRGNAFSIMTSERSARPDSFYPKCFN